ncbi:MAG: hypothetical protein QMC93_01720 [Patescibacteria group bacterium]|nr:hypothetical protein [Patescibacteria group bacterium]
MKEIIEKLQNLIYSNPHLSEKEKEDYFIRLEALKEVRDEKTENALKKILPQIEKNPDSIKEFFVGIDKIAKAYIEKGAKGIIY